MTKRWKKKKKKENADKKEAFHLCKLTREAVKLQLTSRCLKSRLEQLKIHFQRKPSSG